MYSFITFLLFTDGLIVGAGVVSLLTLLDLVPRLCQISNTYEYVKHYEYVLVGSGIFGCLVSLTDLNIHFNKVFLSAVALANGIFIGLLACALAETLDVIPVFERRFRLQKYLKYILFVLIMGKMLGSLFDFLVLKG